LATAARRAEGAFVDVTFLAEAVTVGIRQATSAAATQYFDWDMIGPVT